MNERLSGSQASGHKAAAVSGNNGVVAEPGSRAASVAPAGPPGCNRSAFGCPGAAQPVAAQLAAPVQTLAQRHVAAGQQHQCAAQRQHGHRLHEPRGRQAGPPPTHTASKPSHTWCSTSWPSGWLRCHCLTAASWCKFMAAPWGGCRPSSVWCQISAQPIADETADKPGMAARAAADARRHPPAAQLGKVPGSRMLLSTWSIWVRPQKAIVRSSSLWMISSALVTPGSPIAPRP